MMYVHAWQSYIWNRVLSERVRLFGCENPIVGDLVLVNSAEKLEEEDAGAEEESVAGPISLDADLEDGGEFS